MKNYLTLIFLIVISFIVNAQAPQGFNYQATVRNSAGDLMVNQNVNFKLNLMQGSQTAATVYTEIQAVLTDDLGHVNFFIGQGTVMTGVFSAIDWSLGNYYLGIELDTGSGYVVMGISQLLSVPYALYAENSGNATPPIPNLEAVLLENNSANDQQIKELQDPTEAQDAATKSYVDAILANLQAQIDDLLEGIVSWPDGTVFCSGDQTEVIEVKNGATGKIWMDRNLGASRAAQSSSDADGFGDLYQWGRFSDGHQCRNSETLYGSVNTDNPHSDWIIASQQEGSNYSWRIPINLNLWQGVDGINNPCPKGFRLPTQAEFDEEKGSWGSNNQNTGGAWNNTPLKLPAAGRRGGRSSGEGAGNIAEGNSTLYWVSGSGTSPAIRVFQLTGTNANFSPSASDVGACVRCIKDY